MVVVVDPGLAAVEVWWWELFGAKAVSAITVTDCEQFRAGLLATRRPKTVRNVWQMLDRVLEYAYEHKAIGAVVDRLSG